jgi:hypothetical protein
MLTQHYKKIEAVARRMPSCRIWKIHLPESRQVANESAGKNRRVRERLFEPKQPRIEAR